MTPSYAAPRQTSGSTGIAFVLVAVAAAVGLGIALLHLWTFGRDGPITNPVDFRAFYCSSRVLLDAADPYRYAALRDCQAAVLAAGGLQSDDLHVLFAALPPAAIAAFSFLAILPFRIATVAWLVLSIFAVAYTIFAASSLTRLPRLAVASAFFGCLAIASLLVAQVVPLLLAGICFASLAVRRNDGNAAVLGMSVGVVEPHLALPIWLSLAIFVPSSRRGLCLFAAAAVTLSLVWAPLTLEYFSSIVGAHARSEIFNFSAQYSLSSLLAAAGIAVPIALALGAASYALALVVGLYLGRRLATTYADPAFLVLTPLAAVLLGGPFLHIHQIAGAMPLALLSFAHARSRTSRVALLAAIVALAIPWQTVAESHAFADRPGVQSASLAHVALSPPRPMDSVEKSYTAYVDAFAKRLDRRSISEQFLWKVPTWLALLLLAWFAWSARNSRGTLRSAPLRAPLRFRDGRRSE